jgi:energy-coupling factor transport system substrate-specific component
MAICGYTRYGLLPALMAGAASSQFGTVWTSILFGWDPGTAKDVWLAVPINLVSGALLSGLIGYLLAKAVARTGLIRSAQ